MDQNEKNFIMGEENDPNTPKNKVGLENNNYTQDVQTFKTNAAFIGIVISGTFMWSGK
jgi:hypothetical protein